MTEVYIVKRKIIDIDHNIFAIGSCFSIEIKNFFKRKGIFILSNPFGTMYNSYSIYNCFKRILELKYYNKKEITFYNNKYFSFDHSTKYSSTDIDISLNTINKKLDYSHKYLKKAQIFIITLGTSIVYKYRNNIVANCHKLPHSNFSQEILTVEDNIKNISKIIDLLNIQVKNPVIILTLSPIRHNKEDLSLNCYSKSILKVAIQNFINNKNIFYFPSFEIVFDELRDYQYYKNDKIHLKKRSINHIFDKFINTYFTDKMIKYLKQFDNIYKAYKHKPNEYNIEYLTLLKNCLQQLNELKKIKDDLLIEKTKLKIIHKIIKYSTYSNELLINLEPYFDNSYKQILSNFFNDIFTISEEKPNFNILKKIRDLIFVKKKLIL